ncbi:MAG: ankyrin repeat domain-containing protein, partial [Magnetospirillum sp.]
EAAFLGEPVLARALIDGKADVNRATRSGWTPLHLAAVCARGDIAELLLSHGAEVSARDHMGATPLHWIAVATSAGVKIDFMSSWIDNVEIHGWISGESYLAFARLLVSNKADVNVADSKGRTPLALALKGAGEEIHPGSSEYGHYLRKKYEAIADLLRGAEGRE